jgi:hypothetical protein
MFRSIFLVCYFKEYIYILHRILIKSKLGKER